MGKPRKRRETDWMNSCAAPFVVLLSEAMIAVQLWSVDAEELEQVLKLSLAVVCGRHDDARDAGARLFADCCESRRCCCSCRRDEHTERQSDAGRDYRT